MDFDKFECDVDDLISGKGFLGKLFGVCCVLFSLGIFAFLIVGIITLVTPLEFRTMPNWVFIILGVFLFPFFVFWILYWGIGLLSSVITAISGFVKIIIHPKEHWQGIKDFLIGLGWAVLGGTVAAIVIPLSILAIIYHLQFLLLGGD